MACMVIRDELRRRLANGSAAACRLRGDEGARPGDREPTGPLPAAVLVGLIGHAAGPAILLTQRTDHLRDHAGQISFPGGRAEARDPSLLATAMRETEEELGLASERIEILGELAPYDTITGFRIHPFVGWIAPPVALVPDCTEVADVFELPLDFVLDPANHHRQAYRRGSLTRGYYVLPYEGRFIWGATAGILVNLSSLLRA